MDEFRWIIMSSFLMLEFKFTAATRQLSSFTVRSGVKVTLPCENVKDDQDKCDGTWLFSDSEKTVTRFALGQIHKEAKNKSDRLSVTANCSLVIKKVTVEDAGFYTCRQYKKLGKHQIYNKIYLFVINITEHKDTDKMMLSCSVSKHGRCEHTVKWLYEGKTVDAGHEHVETSQSDCSATVIFPTSFLKQTSKQHELFKCNVTNIYNKEVQLLTFSLQSSGDKTGDDATMTIQSPSTTRNKWTSVKMNTSEETNNNNQTKQGWWQFIIVSVGVAALLIIIVAVIRWKRTKGKQTQVDENMADPEDGVSYASISYTKKTNCKARFRGDDDDDDDEGDAVTYSTVKASSSSAGASADPSSLYATINKPKK